MKACSMIFVNEWIFVVHPLYARHQAGYLASRYLQGGISLQGDIKQSRRICSLRWGSLAPREWVWILIRALERAVPFFFLYVMTWAADGRRRRRGNPGAWDDSSEVLRFLCLSANCRRQVKLNRRRGLTPLARFWIALCDDTHKCAYLLLGTESKVEFLPPL